jgi:hypothetical protein
MKTGSSVSKVSEFNSQRLVLHRDLEPCHFETPKFSILKLQGAL